MREIGSEFWEVPVIEEQNAIFPDNTQWFLSGRSALKNIIKSIHHCKSIALPSWCCSSMVIPFIDASIDVKFYPVWFDNGLHYELRYDCDALFLIDYFGYTYTNNITIEYNGIIIRDVTHSIFSFSYTDADYYFGSLRKWCGIWTGGFAWRKDKQKLPVLSSSSNSEYEKLRKQAMEMKERYISGITHTKEYLNIFGKAEDMLEGTGIFIASERDVELALRLDVNKILTKHKTNAEKLITAFPDWLVFQEMKKTDCPMFVPIIVPNGKRNELRQYLIDNSIFCPIHWPISKYHKMSKQEQYIYDNELSLICDQRYSIEDMERIVKTIKQFMEA